MRMMWADAIEEVWELCGHGQTNIRTYNTQQPEKMVLLFAKFITFRES